MSTDGTKTETKPTTPDALALAQEKLEQKEKEIAAVVAKNQELLEEKRKAMEKAEQEAREKKQLEEQKLADTGKHEQLAKMYQEEARLQKEKAQTVENERMAEKARNEAMKLAVTMADGVNAELLADYIERRIKYTAEGPKVLDSLGGMTVSSLDDLKREFENSDRFKSLLRGSKASGGGASGSGSGGQQGGSGRVVTRSEFAKWKPAEQMKFMTSGGKTVKG